MALSSSDCILAIASPPGHSLRGIVRISGAACFDLLRDHLHIKTRSVKEAARGAYPARLTLGDNQLSCTVILMKGPHSYTGEHCAELQLPGNPTLLQRVAQAVIEHGHRAGIAVRPAEPGEFTARAFLNGRLSLTQAEGVAATIAAQSDAELRAAHMLSSGALGAFARSLADDLANVLALVEAGIDFTDQEDVVAISPEQLYRRVLDLRQRIDHQLKHSVGSEQLRAIPWVVLVGQPNAGKSALFNALLGHERAVVSPISGTTRDVLTEPLPIHTPHGVAEVMLVDIAGLDVQDSAINSLMQQAAAGAISRAELTLRCVPVDEPVTQWREGEILVRTKCDLPHNTAEQKQQTMQTLQSQNVPTHELSEVCVSAIRGDGIEELKTRIAQRLADRAVSLAADATALRPRHEAALQSALGNLSETIALVQPVRHEHALAYPELIASTMRAALNDLAALAGDMTPDDVLGRIFATFCVGK